MLRAGGVRFAYGEHQALGGVDLDIAEGEICGLLGPNGAGKTTFVSIITGLLRADAGAVDVDGRDALDPRSGARQLIGVAPQELGVYPVLTVWENLVFFGELNGVPRRELGERIQTVAVDFELVELLDRRVAQLSGGEQRRVHSAAAILHRPRLLMLDEPTTGVDVATRQRILEAVRRLADEDGAAICYTTHYLAEVEMLDASVAIIDGGEMIARGAVSDLVQRHGISAVELTFTGPVPELRTDGPVTIDGGVAVVGAVDPASEAAHILAELGPDADRLTSVDLVSAGLESVFLSLTGRRFQSEEAS